MRFLIITAILLGVAFVACGGGDDDEKDTDSTVQIMQVMTYIQNSPPAQVEPRGVILTEEGPQDCLIPTSGNGYVPGTCEWVVTEGLASWGVTYTETWNCSDYIAAIGEGAYCPGETAEHVWNYAITSDGVVQLLVESGATAPENAGSGAPSH